jgi:putative endonuclease
MRQLNVHQYFTYMLTNEWRNVLYTGVTNSLETRIWQHKMRAVEGFTKKYNCTVLVYYEIYEDVNQTIAREKQIKSWSRAKKNSLVETMNPKWNDLASDWYLEIAGDPSPSSAAGAAPAARDDRQREPRSAAPPSTDPATPPAQDDTQRKR